MTGGTQVGDPEESEGQFYCSCCGLTLESKKSFYPARLGANTYYCRDCVASEDAPQWIVPPGS